MTVVIYCETGYQASRLETLANREKLVCKKSYFNSIVKSDKSSIGTNQRSLEGDLSDILTVLFSFELEMFKKRQNQRLLSSQDNVTNSWHYRHR
jgi:hypothetical protein